MNLFRCFGRVGVVLVAAGCFAISGVGWAVERPYSAFGTARFVSPSDFVGEGQATHLGRYTEAGSVQFSPTPDPTVLQVEGWTTYTSAKGDELYALLSGRLNALTGAITVTVTYDGGTGRFENARGSANLTGQIQPDGSIGVKVRGRIDY